MLLTGRRSPLYITRGVRVISMKTYIYPCSSRRDISTSTHRNLSLPRRRAPAAPPSPDAHSNRIQFGFWVVCCSVLGPGLFCCSIIILRSSSRSTDSKRRYFGEAKRRNKKGNSNATQERYRLRFTRTLPSQSYLSDAVAIDRQDRN